jgi:hypothetical protein
LKARKRQTKYIKNLVEVGEECASSFESYSQYASNTADDHEDMAGILDISTRMENHINRLFLDLVW